MHGVKSEGTEGGKKGLIGTGKSDSGKHPISKAFSSTLTEIDRSLTLNLNPKVPRTRPTSIHRTRGALTRKDTTITRQLSSGPSIERTEMSGDDSVVRELALVGDSLNYKQRSDDLSNPSSRQTSVRRSGLRESTNLNLSEDRHEDIHSGVPRAPRSNNQQRAHGVKGTRLDEHSDDGFAQSADSGYPQSSASVPGVQDESDGDHEGEEDVE